MGAKEVGYEGDFEFVAAFWAVVCGGFFVPQNKNKHTASYQRYPKVPISHKQEKGGY